MSLGHALQYFVVDTINNEVEHLTVKKDKFIFSQIFIIKLSPYSKVNGIHILKGTIEFS